MCSPPISISDPTPKSRLYGSFTYNKRDGERGNGGGEEVRDRGREGRRGGGCMGEREGGTNHLQGTMNAYLAALSKAL